MVEDVRAAAAAGQVGQLAARECVCVYDRLQGCCRPAAANMGRPCRFPRGRRRWRRAAVAPQPLAAPS
jgi:hypothetical protein